MEKREKGFLDLREIKSRGVRKKWFESIGCNIYYTTSEKEYTFKLIDYTKGSQLAKIEYNGDVYDIQTGGILSCNFGNVIGNCVKYFRYKPGDIVRTKRKEFKVLDSFRNHKGKKSYTCECCDCGNVKKVDEDHLVNRGFVCNICSEKISYPERVMGSFLNQLGWKCEYQKRFSWSNNLINNEGNNTYKVYDFYIPSMDTIVEVHGEIHYKEGRWSKCRPINEITSNDEVKKDLAIKNGIKRYITIDCMESDIEYIKNNIIKSDFGRLFDLSEIDWDRCEFDSSKSLMRVCSDLWNSGMKSTKDIAKEVGVSKQTVITYLKKFSKLGLNEYDPKKEIKSGLGKKPGNARSVLIFKDGNLEGEFESVAYLSRESVKLFGVNLLPSQVAAVCRGDRKSHKGYTFKYTEEKYKQIN